MAFKILLKWLSGLSPNKIQLLDRGKKKYLLTTIGMSHFSERARWMLDQSPLKDDYIEDRHCPAFHISTTAFALSKLPKIILNWEGKRPVQEGNSSSRYSARHLT